ncbi:MAG: hypothetical protein ACI8ZM_002415 [Crocinitomix sp.]|jgi:hypothetical protein
MNVRSRNMKDTLAIPLIFLLLLFGGYQVHAQDEMVSQTDEIKYGLQFRAGTSFSQNSDHLILNIYEGYWLEPVSLDMRYELNFVANIRNKWTLFTGLNYSNRNFEGTYYCHVCDFFVFPNGPEKLTFRFLEVPLYLRYNLLDRKINWHVEAGLDASFTLNRPTIWYGEKLDVNRFNLNFFAGTGLNYDVNNRINVNLTVGYRRQLYSKAWNEFQAAEIKAGIIYYLK